MNSKSSFDRDGRRVPRNDPFRNLKMDMQPILFKLCLAFLAFGAINCILSLSVMLGARAMRFDCPPPLRARRFFLLRIFPSVSSLLFILVFFAPFIGHDEPGTKEHLSIAMGVLAAAAASMPILAGARAVQSALSTRRLENAWASSAQTLTIAGVSIPTFIIDARFPVVAVTGIFSQRLHIARQVLEACSPAEVAAIVAHERAHVQHRDNGHQLLLRCCPDVLGATPMAGWLERGWAQAREEVADDAAVHTGMGLDLAAALCKVARLAQGQLSYEAMALHHGGDVTHRVKRIVGAQRHNSKAPSRGTTDGWAFVMALLALLTGSFMGLGSVHAATEVAVKFLQ